MMTISTTLKNEEAFLGVVRKIMLRLWHEDSSQRNKLFWTPYTANGNWFGVVVDKDSHENINQPTDDHKSLTLKKHPETYSIKRVKNM